MLNQVLFLAEIFGIADGGFIIPSEITYFFSINWIYFVWKKSGMVIILCRCTFLRSSEWSFHDGQIIFISVDIPKSCIKIVKNFEKGLENTHYIFRTLKDVILKFRQDNSENNSSILYCINYSTKTLGCRAKNLSLQKYYIHRFRIFMDAMYWVCCF